MMHIRKIKKKIRKELAKKRNQRKLFVILSTTIVVVLLLLLGGALYSRQALHDSYQKQLLDRKSELHSLNSKLKQIKKQNAKTTSKLRQKKQNERNLQKKIDSLRKQLQAKRKQSLIDKFAEKITPVAYATPSVNWAMEYIFKHESGNNLAAVNPSSGACGLGQALPCSKLINACPNYTTDRACQVSFFTDYANRRYGGWSGAYQFWENNRWW